MARSNNSLQYLAGAVAVVAVAFSVGYFVIGGNRPQPTLPENVVVQPSPVVAPAPVKPPTISPRTKNGDYTAPGAPRIRIVEDKNPSLVDTSSRQPKPPQAAQKPADPEASQEAAPPPPVIQADVPPSDATTTSPGAGTDTSPAPADAPAKPGTDTTPTPAPPPTPNADPDVEQVGGHTDPEASQEAPGGKAQFRVQAGSFAASSNAKALADALRRRGYVTSTHAEQDGDKTVYKVQVGAYRTRTAADKAAQDLQSSGYPASVSPIGP